MRDTRLARDPSRARFPLSLSNSLNILVVAVLFVLCFGDVSIAATHSSPSQRHHHLARALEGSRLKGASGIGTSDKGRPGEGRLGLDTPAEEHRSGQPPGAARAIAVNLARSNRNSSSATTSISTSSSSASTSTHLRERTTSRNSKKTRPATPSRSAPSPSTTVLRTTRTPRHSSSTLTRSSSSRRKSTRPSTRINTSSSSRQLSTSTSTSSRNSSTSPPARTETFLSTSTSTSHAQTTNRPASSTRSTTNSTGTASTGSSRPSKSRPKPKPKPKPNPTPTSKQGLGVTETPSSVRTRTSQSTSSAPKSSPTSYGYAPRESCVEPPSTFEGSSKGFANLCRVRYCDARPRRNMIWSGYKVPGGVTREEIESSLGMLMQLEPVWENGQGNILGDGALGQGAYSASLLFEITGDIRALDVAVRIADNILALQNQNTENPVVIWTGEADPVWPTHTLPPNNNSELVYAGCEQGEIVSNMVNAALMILKSPCLWKKIPPVYHGPTVFNRTATYYDRALAYIAAGDDTYENYFFRFFDSAGSIIQPADGRWWAVGDTRAPGTLMPWNRRMQIVHGALKLAAAHETPPAFNPNVTRYYDAIVQRNVMDFLGALNQTRGKVEGMDIFRWDYSAMEEHTEESKGIHALWDIFGSWLAWQRSSASYYLSNDFGLVMAQTFEYQIHLGNGSFGGLVTGESTEKAYTIDSLWGHWSFYGYFLPQWYETVAKSNVEHGFQGRTWQAIPLLWTKYALYLNDLTFWTGRYSSGYGYVLGTEGRKSSLSNVQWSAGARSESSMRLFFALSVLLSGLYLSL